MSDCMLAVFAFKYKASKITKYNTRSSVSAKSSRRTKRRSIRIIGLSIRVYFISVQFSQGFNSSRRSDAFKVTQFTVLLPIGFDNACIIYAPVEFD